MKHIKEMEMNSGDKNICQCIIETQINVLTKRFCDITNKYYKSVTNYRERCKTTIDHQIQIGLHFSSVNYLILCIF